jgi:hypothetical protein
VGEDGAETARLRMSAKSTRRLAVICATALEVTPSSSLDYRKLTSSGGQKMAAPKGGCRRWVIIMRTPLMLASCAAFQRPTPTSLVRCRMRHQPPLVPRRRTIPTRRVRRAAPDDRPYRRSRSARPYGPFVRGGVQWRELRATAGRASCSGAARACSPVRTRSSMAGWAATGQGAIRRPACLCSALARPRV